jgi:hypothetical protein
MCYKTETVFLLYLVTFSLVPFYPAKGYSIHKEGMPNSLCAQSVSIILAQYNQKDSSRPKQSGRSTEEKESGKEQKSTSPGKSKKTAPLKDFEPSEKIEAEKAVDFPVDI